MFLNMSSVIMHGEKVLEVSRVIELGVRRVVYLHVARLHLSRFFRWFLWIGPNNPLSSWYQRVRLIIASWKTTSWLVVASRRVGEKSRCWTSCELQVWWYLATIVRGGFLFHVGEVFVDDALL